MKKLGKRSHVTFSNGETRLLDATELNGPVYEELKAPEIFNDITIDHGVVTWKDGEIDCSPEYMYDISYEYSNHGRIVKAAVNQAYKEDKYHDRLQAGYEVNVSDKKLVEEENDASREE